MLIFRIKQQITHKVEENVCIERMKKVQLINNTIRRKIIKKQNKRE